ncbi:MAG: chemotaxis protein CheA [Myxococcales bacterium]|nr:chemotaxis protein CheA [Myxococcales bacterium]
MPVDMSKYLSLFVTEATEHLESLGRDLVELEKTGGTASIDSMFRHAHSVKGMAASMGFEVAATLAHRVEDLVDAVRSDASLLDRELVDLLLSTTDTLLSQVRAAAEGQPPEDSGPIERQLSERLARITGRSPSPTKVAQATARPSAPPVPPAAPKAPAPAEKENPQERDAGLGLPPRFGLKVRIAQSCAVPGVRAFLVHKRLSGLGNVFDLKPALEDLKAGRIPDGLVSLELETSAGEAGVRGALGNISEVEVLSLKPVVFTAPSPPAPMPSPESAKVVGHEAARTVRVRTELLDYFLDTAGELLLATARIREVGKALPARSQPSLDEAVDRLHGLVKDLHDKVMKARMTPLSVITDRLPRAARDIARRRERDVDLVVTGADIELDRAILDDLADPLLHLLRNCIDHGIESPEERAAQKKGARGRVLVSVRRARDRVVVEIEDDGRGMDPEKLKAAALARGLITAEVAGRLSDAEAYTLCCLPGVSTARDVSEISGRGVGMDAVKRAVESVGGTLEIESERGRGTRFILKLPLTVAVVNLLLVAVGEEIFGLPIAKVIGAVEAEAGTLSRSREAALLPYAGSLLPVHPMADLLGIPDLPRVGPRPFVVMEAESGRVALAVDRLLGQEEVVLKALSRPLDLVPGLSGVTILGTGRPVFILDVPRLLAA